MHQPLTVYFLGFYIHSRLFPRPIHRGADLSSKDEWKLLLAPFCGKPACQFINVVPAKGRGVCFDAFLQQRTVLVPDVESYPGHIACDGDTKSEIVVPLMLQSDGQEDVALGVLDLDCLALGGFDEEDKVRLMPDCNDLPAAKLGFLKAGLERIAALVVSACDW